MLKVSKIRENFFRFGLVIAGFSAAAAMSVWAATTISTNLSTGGTLSVTGLSTQAGINASGVVNASSTAHVSGNTILTTLTTSGALNASSTAHVDGNTLLASRVGISTSTPSAVWSFSVEGNSLVTGRLRVGGITSTSTVKIGSSGTALAQVLYSGTCTVNPPSMHAGGQSHASCTDATGVSTSDTVFMSKAPPAGWDNEVVVTSASSTDTNTINFVFRNNSTTTVINIGSLAIPWMSVQ